jgi:capsular polysaccharide transport system permease protein
MLFETLPPTPPRRDPLHIQRAVLFALFVRDLRSRVQGRWEGLIWTVFEPLAHVLVILALVGFRQHAVSPNVELPVFLVTGMIPFFMFRNLARRLPLVVGQNRGLFAYRQVRPLDAMAARAAVEIGLYSAVYATALGLLGWLGYHCVPHAPLELAGVSVVLLALGVGLALIFVVVQNNRPRVANTISLSFLPLYLLSGVIFPVHHLGPDVRELLLWNPVLHLIELSRFYFIPQHMLLPGAGLGYPAAWALATLALGMALYRLNRHDLVVRD